MHEFINNNQDSKNLTIKEAILKFTALNKEVTIANVAKDINLSIPTVVKLINELIDNGFLLDMGKHDSMGGRKPNVYGINPAHSYFIGVDACHNSLTFHTVDLTGKFTDNKIVSNFTLEDTPENLDFIIKETSKYIDSLPFSSDKVATIGLAIKGRVNINDGRTISYFNYLGKPVAEVLAEKLGHRIIIENDTKAVTYGEYITHYEDQYNNLLYVNLDWGIGLGLILNGSLYYGKSGYTGEMGHAIVFNNQQICTCGKRGCLETEISGRALCRKIAEKYAQGEQTILKDVLDKRGYVTLDEAIKAVNKEDMLSIEIVEQMGRDLGRFLAGIINILNPEMLVIGGKVSQVDSYLRLAIVSTLNKTSQNIVTSDTEVVTSKLKDEAGAIGMAMLARNRFLKLC